MTGGIVVGGWEYVIMAYSLTGIAFLVYGVTLITKLREVPKRRSTK